MTDAPERIWARTPKPSGGVQCVISFTTPSEDYATEFVRADLAPAWQPIATAPTDGTPVDIWAEDHNNDGFRHTDMKFKNGGPGEDADWDHEMYCMIGDGLVDSLEQVTHWMPLPTSPEGADHA